MAQIPQINNPITSKNYNYSPRQQQDANTEPFDVVKLTGVGGAGVNSDSASKSRLEMGNRELIPLQVQAPKDPTLAVEMLKDLLNVEVLNQALVTGHTELYGSLQNLAKELYVSSGELVEEIQNQEQQNTMFSGHEFYDVLREVAQTTSDPNTKELIGNLLKSINFAQNKNEILGALRANLKFLSEYYSPNEKLSQKLLDLSRKWGADDADKYFEMLKGETLAILKDVSGSLLNDDKTQMLLPLITHNLSRYNNNPYMCKEQFNLLLTQISSGTLRESLKNSFNRLYSAIFDKKPMQNPHTMESVASGERADLAAGQDPRIMGNVTSESRRNNSANQDPRVLGEVAKSNEEVPTFNYTTNDLKNQPLSQNSSEKNLFFEESNAQIQQNSKISSENIGEIATSVREPIAIFDSEGQQIGFQDPNINRILDENGNVIPFTPEQPVFDAEGRQLGYLPPAMFDEFGSMISGLPLMDEEGNFIPFQAGTPVFDENGSAAGYLAQPLFDENGELIQQTLVDANGNPMAFTPRFPVYDESGEQVGYSANLFSQNGNLVLNQPLVDINGNILPFIPAKPLFDEYGEVAAYQPRALFDAEGEPIMQPLVDGDGYPLAELPQEPVLNDLGEQIGFRVKLFDNNGECVLSEQVFDIEGNPVSEKAEQEPREITGWHKYLNEQMSDSSYTQRLKASGFNPESIVNAYNRGRLGGTDALKTMIDGLFMAKEDPQAQEQVELMHTDLAKVNTMQELIDELNSLLRDLPDVPMRERLYGVFVDIIDKMAIKSELPQHGIRPPVSSTLDNLTDFIQVNINNPALKSLDSFNASNLLQSLLNAPGVFTPLAHYILPLEVENTRAFGELWVDNDENNPNNTPGTQRNYHLFLTFDVETIGRFELDMYALGENVNLSLLYPPKFEKEVEPMKDRVNKIIHNIGYKAQNFETAPLKKPHNLVEVFPKITDKRVTLNKRV